MSKVLVCINAFKGYKTSREINQIVTDSLANCGFETQSIPVSDGGDGFREAVKCYLKPNELIIQSVDLLGKRFQHPVLWDENSRTVFIESADVIGCKACNTSIDSYHSSSFGLGVTIRQCLRLRPLEIIIGLGGGLISDAGLGMLQALGCQVRDKYRNVIGEKRFLDASDLGCVSEIDGRTDIVSRPVKFTAVCDVQIPLLGSNGQARTFGPQKGHSEIEIEKLEEGYKNLVKVLSVEDDSNLQIAGASGGVATMLYAVLGSKLLNGTSYFLENSYFCELLKDSNILITGEGQLDKSTLIGKAPFVLSQLASNLDKQVIYLTGINRLNDKDSNQLGNVIQLGDIELVSASEYWRNLAGTVARVGREYLGASVAKI